MLGWLKAGQRPEATDEGRRVIKSYVSEHPSHTRNTYSHSPRALGDALRADYMSQRGSGLPFINKGMKLSDYLKSSQAQSIADEYGGFFSPRHGYEQWVRGETAPGTVDTRNDYQIGMNVLRNKYPGAYAEQFPISDFMMRDFPKLAMGFVGSQAGIPAALAYAPSTIDQGVSIYNRISDMFSGSNEDEIPWWQFWNQNEKARGGIMSTYANGGPHQDDGVPWTYSSPSSYSAPPNPVNTYFGGSHDADYNWNPPKHPGEDHLEAALSLAAAGIKNLAGDKVGEGPYSLTDTLNVSGQGEGTKFWFDETGQIDPPGQDTFPPGPGPGPGGSWGNYWGGRRSGSGSPILDEAFENAQENLGSAALKEQGKEQFNTQFMAAQLLHDLSRKGYDAGGLADMSEGTLGEFDTAKSKWKWKYDEQIKGLMNKGFSLKEAIDEMYNKYQLMPYKGFNIGVAT